MTPVSVMSLQGQIAGDTLSLEHALIMLLLLVGLLSIQKEQRRFVPWVVLGGVALSLFTPTHSLDVAWPLISVLVLPPLLWQVAVRLATVRSTFTWRAWLAWLLTALLVGVALALAARLSPASALLLGILAASLVWQVRERATGGSELGAFGQLALALLLAEVDVMLHPLGPFLGSLFAGTGLGLLLGYLGVRAAFRLPVGNARHYFFLGLAYLAYLAGTLIGASGVVTAVMTGLMVSVYGYNAGLWPTMELLPAPLNHLGVFAPMAGAFLLLGWQAHVPLSATRVAGLVLATVAAAVGIGLGRRVAPVPEEETAERVPYSLLRKERKVLLLLLGTLLLWPQQAALEAGPLAIALLASLLTVPLLRLVLYPAFELLGMTPPLSDVSSGQTEELPSE